MGSTPDSWPKHALSETLGLGVSIGILHALSETILLAWNGVRLTSVDLAIFGAASMLGGAACGVAAALFFLLPPLSARFGGPQGPQRFRACVWTIVIAAYVLVYWKIIYYQFGWWGILRWSLPAVPPLSLGAFAVYRKGGRTLIPLLAAALITTSLCALQLAHADWGYEMAESEVIAVRLLTPVLLCFVALIAAVRTTPAAAAVEPFRRGAPALAVLIVLWAALLAVFNVGLPLGHWFRESPPANPARPNILLIVLDTVRADHLDLFGYQRATMPNLRQFATDDAQTASRMFTSGSWTLPSHASMFTGLYPSAHGAHYPFVNEKEPQFLASSMREDVPTLAEFLGSLGYQTAGIVANFGVLSHFGISRGFDDYAAKPGPAYFAPHMLWFYRFRIGDWSPGEWLRHVLPGAIQGRSNMFSVREPDTERAHAINARAREWLNRHAGRPFFLFLNYMDAHDPYLPIPEDDERFLQRPAGEEWFGFPRERLADAKRGAAKFTADEIEFLKAQYDAELVSLDREIGRLFSYLKESSLFENTLIIVTTDHGEAFFEHGFPDHGNSLYQPEIGGFLLIKMPSSLAPIEISPWMQHVDLFPTIAALMGEPAPGEMQGRPGGVGRNYALSEVFCKSCGREVFEGRWPDALRHDLVAVMNGAQKLIRSTAGADKVYEYIEDPAETNPLADPDPSLLQTAEQAIAARNQRLIETLSKRPEDKTLLEKLRSLGYVQ